MNQSRGLKKRSGFDKVDHSFNGTVRPKGSIGFFEFFGIDSRIKI